MNNQKIYRYTLPFVFFLMMLIDGHISSALLGYFSVPMDFTSNLLLIVLMFSTFQMEKSYMITWSSIIGLLYDSYYYNILGVNFVLLPIMVMLTYLLFEHVIPNTYTIILSVIIFVTTLSIGRASMLVLFNLTNGTALDFFVRTLAPTLGINILLILLLIIPLKRWFNVKN